MDFSTLDARTAAETARPLQLRNQQTGEPIWDGDKPCMVMVIGVSSRTAQEAIKAASRAQMKAKDDESRTFQDLHNEACRAAQRLVVGLENIELNGKPAGLGDIGAILDMTFYNATRNADGTMARPSFAQQIIEFAADDASFLQVASKP